jgi:hypothetical protein
LTIIGYVAPHFASNWSSPGAPAFGFEHRRRLIDRLQVGRDFGAIFLGRVLQGRPHQVHDVSLHLGLGKRGADRW